MTKPNGKARDQFNVCISDLHCGGTTAIFPDYKMQFTLNGKPSYNHTPTAEQKAMYRHLMQSAKTIKERAKGKQLSVRFNGDLIEGYHHSTVEVVSTFSNHHVEIFKEICDEFLKELGFSVKNGDSLDFTSGTETHTGWLDNEISQLYGHLGAAFYDELKIVVNGRSLWFTHHGSSGGDGQNEGDGYRNWLKRIYYSSLKEKTTPPDVVVSSHFHKSVAQVYVQDWHYLYGFLLPSLQMKTRYAIRATPFQRNDIGLQTFEVTAEGSVVPHRSMLLATKKVATTGRSEDADILKEYS